jgi:hypothetical protein
MRPSKYTQGKFTSFGRRDSANEKSLMMQLLPAAPVEFTRTKEKRKPIQETAKKL